VAYWRVDQMREAGLIYDAAAKLLGRPAQNFSSEESEHIVLPVRFVQNVEEARKRSEERALKRVT